MIRNRPRRELSPAAKAAMLRRASDLRKQADALDASGQEPDWRKFRARRDLAMSYRVEASRLEVRTMPDPIYEFSF